METIEFTESDISLVARWNVQLHEDEASNPMEIKTAEERYRRWLRDGIFKGLIFKIGERSIGYVIYEHRRTHPDSRDKETIYIRQFFIAREHRRKGYGAKAFRTILETIVPDSVGVKLNVKYSNPAAQLFWGSLGFKPENIEYEFSKA